MQVPIRITFRDLPPSEALESDIRQHAEHLERLYDRITRCRVVVESPHRRHHQGNLYHVRIDLTVPGGELVVNRDPHERHAHEDAYVAIRDAFTAAARQLEDYARRQRGHVKAHEGLPTGIVTRLAAEEGYGFIETPDGRQVYFHRNSVVDDQFVRLAVGSTVEFLCAETESANGPQATTVKPVAAQGAGAAH